MNTAQQAAESFGIPADLFWSVCEYLETRPVDSENPHYRYAPNTRARALAICRKMWALRMEQEVAP